MTGPNKLPMTHLPPLPLVDGALFIDNSGWMENLSTCLRKLEYNQLSRRVSSETNAATNFGTTIHTGLEYRYVAYQNRSVDDGYYLTLSGLLQEHFDTNPQPEGDFRTLNWAMELMRKYNERYDVEDFNLLEYDQPIDCPHCEGKGAYATQGIDELELHECIWCNGTGKRSVMVEMPFALPLYTHEGKECYSVADGGQTHIPVYYSGKIDLAISFQGRIFVMDHKTTSLLGPSFFDKMRMSSQQKGYCWAFETLTKRKVHGYFVNAIRTKEPPLYVTESKERSSREGKKLTPTQWWNESFAREYYFLKDGELAEWRNNTIEQVEEFFWHYARGYLPMRTEWCAMYGRCPYYEVCSLEPQSRGLTLASTMFKDNTWSPLNKKQHVTIYDK